MRQLTQPNPTQLRDVTFYDVLLPIIPSERLLDRQTVHINFDLAHDYDIAVEVKVRHSARSRGRSSVLSVVGGLDSHKCDSLQ